ncbi:SAM-dependent methyltransferase [Salinifilum ghardaiensis]
MTSESTRGLPDRPDVAGIDLDRPNAGRMYDYFLGGGHHFAVDRVAAEHVLAAAPSVAEVAIANRSFLNRAVQHCLRCGVDQFLDLGSGLPTVGSTHQIAQHASPRARVVYVDSDPVAVAHARNLLVGLESVDVLYADLGQVRTVLQDPRVRGLLDLSRPVAVLLVAVLHYLPRAGEVVAAYRDALPSGSMLVLAHTTADHQRGASAVARAVFEATTVRITPRSLDQVRDLFAGYDVTAPGVVWTPRWQPDRMRVVDDASEWSETWCGVGVKP